MAKTFTPDRNLPLGSEVEDVVTGLVGMTTSRVEYLNGCIHFGVAPKMDKDGKLPETQFLDYQRLRPMGPGVSKAMAEANQESRSAGHRGGPVGRDTPRG